MKMGSELQLNENAKSKRFQRFRLTLLLCLMAVEVILIVSLRQRGWVATTESTRWILTGFAAFLPLVVAGALLIMSGRRMKLRTLFLCVAAICIFLSVSLTPLIAVRRSRTAARELLQLGAELRPCSYGDFDYDNPDRNFMTNERFSTPDDIPSWLRPLSRELESIPRDCEIAWVILSDDDQVDAFVRRVENLKDVRCLELTNGVTDKGIRKLAAVHNQLPQLNALGISTASATPKAISELGKFSTIRWLLLNGVSIPQDGWFDSFPQLRQLNVWDEFAIVTNEPSQLSQANIEAISKLQELRDVCIREIDMNGIDLSSLARLKNLINLTLKCWNLNSVQVNELQRKRPNVRLWINGMPPGYISGNMSGPAISP